jgi:hypothetical protein
MEEDPEADRAQVGQTTLRQMERENDYTERW